MEKRFFVSFDWLIAVQIAASYFKVLGPHDL